MAFGLTDYGATQILAGNAMPLTLWAQFHTGDPTKFATANVATEGTRISTTFEAAVADYTIQNDADVVWAGPHPANETVTHMSFWTAASAGNPWFILELSPTLDLALGGNTTYLVENITTSLNVYGA